MIKLTLRELATTVGGSIIQGNPDLQFDSVTIDSRRITQGDLFVAIKGERFDGHDFIEQAVQAGAKGVIVERELRTDGEVGVVRVNNTLEALGSIARANRNRLNIPVIGITGSNGKTTTKDLTAFILEQQFDVIKTEGNFNNEIGLPLTLLKITATTEAAVVEMGMRGLGQIKQLADIALPTIGIVTNVGQSHIELLGTQENIARAKSELIQALPEDGVAILNGDDELVCSLCNQTKARVVCFGIDNDNSDYLAKNIETYSERSRCEIYCRSEGTSFKVELPIPGRHNILNALAAIAVAKELGVSNETIQTGLSKVVLTGKRLNITKTRDYWIIDDTYNASPTSMKAALDVLAEFKHPGRKIAVLADMLELGAQSPQFHYEVGVYAGKLGIDRLYAFGDLAKSYVEGYQSILNTPSCYFTDKQTLLTELQTVLQTGDLVLIKGSRGMHMEEIVIALQGEEALT